MGGKAASLVKNVEAESTESLEKNEEELVEGESWETESSIVFLLKSSIFSSDMETNLLNQVGETENKIDIVGGSYKFNSDEGWKYLLPNQKKNIL